VKRWLARHSRFHVHFTPISASRINFIKASLILLANRRLKYNILLSVIGLNQTVRLPRRSQPRTATHPMGCTVHPITSLHRHRTPSHKNKDRALDATQSSLTADDVMRARASRRAPTALWAAGVPRFSSAPSTIVGGISRGD
jgi:hypothetical protein